MVWTGESLKVWFPLMQMGLVSLGWGGIWLPPALANPDPAPSSESALFAESAALAMPEATANFPQNTDPTNEASLSHPSNDGVAIPLIQPTSAPEVDLAFSPRPLDDDDPPETATTEIAVPQTPATTAADLLPLPPTAFGYAASELGVDGAGSASALVDARSRPAHGDDPVIYGAIPEAAIAQSSSTHEDPNHARPDEGDDLDQLPQDPELGVIRVRNPLEDPELGILRIRQQPDAAALPTAPPPKIAFFTARFSGVSSDNILLVVNDVGGLTGGQFYRPSATLAIYPNLGPTTALVGTLDIGLQRYPTQSSLNYDDWRIRIGLRQSLTPRTYAQLNLSYQELLRPGLGPRIFDNKSVGLTLARRDPITPQLTLDTSYQVQYNDARSRSLTSSGAIITDFSRVTHTLNAYLGYTPSNRWHTGLNYQLTILDYTVQNRYDTVQQILAQVVYSITPRVRVSVYGGWSFGGSSDPRIRYDDTILGFSIDTTLPLF